MPIRPEPPKPPKKPEPPKQRITPNGDVARTPSGAEGLRKQMQQIAGHAKTPAPAPRPTNPAEREAMAQLAADAKEAEARRRAGRTNKMRAVAGAARDRAVFLAQISQATEIVGICRAKDLDPAKTVEKCYAMFAEEPTNNAAIEKLRLHAAEESAFNPRFNERVFWEKVIAIHLKTGGIPALKGK